MLLPARILMIFPPVKLKMDSNYASSNFMIAIIQLVIVTLRWPVNAHQNIVMIYPIILF
jgi:hypothetical protein